MKTIITFDENGVGMGIAQVAKDDLAPHEFELPAGFEPQALASRFRLMAGEATDGYPGLTDAEVSAEIARLSAQAAAQVPAPTTPAASKKLTKLAFMSLFTDGELVGIYQAARQSVAVEVWLDKLKLADDVDIADPRTTVGVQNLVGAGLLTQARADCIVVGQAPAMA